MEHVQAARFKAHPELIKDPSACEVYYRLADQNHIEGTTRRDYRFMGSVCDDIRNGLLAKTNKQPDHSSSLMNNGASLDKIRKRLREETEEVPKDYNNDEENDSPPMTWFSPITISSDSASPPPRACPQLSQMTRLRVDGGEEIAGGFIIAGGDGAKLLELAEEVLDEVARLVESPCRNRAGFCGCSSAGSPRFFPPLAAVR